MTAQSLTAQIFDRFRKINGKLTQDQVDAINRLLLTNRKDVELIAGIQTTALISDEGYSLIKKFEGLKLKSYKDSVGIWTIGYGTIRYPNGVPVKAGEHITESQATEFLKSDCKWVENALKRITVPLKQNQYDALASFIYNVGEGAFAKSTLLKRINAKDPNASDEFLKWTKAGGRHLPGLLNRRRVEKNYYDS